MEGGGRRRAFYRQSTRGLGGDSGYYGNEEYRNVENSEIMTVEITLLSGKEVDVEHCSLQIRSNAV